MKKIYRTVKTVFDKIGADEIFTYAAQASFYIITASIPFMMLFLALLQFFVPITEIQAVSMVRTFLPEILRASVETVVAELYEKSAAVISITGITAMWSASRGIAAVERGVRKVYKSKKKPKLIKDILLSMAYTAMFLGALLATLLLMVFGGTIYGFLSKSFLWLRAAAESVGSMRELIYFVGLSVFFSLVYKVFAGKGTRVRDQLFGAVFATLGWFLFSFVFSVYVENFTNFSYVYGSLTMLVLMMFWLYSCMIILLLGAEVNVFIKREKKRKYGKEKKR